jgi:hypothetical protein
MKLAILNHLKKTREFGTKDSSYFLILTSYFSLYLYILWKKNTNH